MPRTRLLALRCALTAATAVRAAAGQPVVDLPSLGFVRGVHEGDVDVYKGLPYAIPPVNALRFAPAEPLVARHAASDPLDAAQFGAWCHQAAYPEKLDPANTYSEDCLFLNAWAPRGSERAPVLVWVHGGGFTQGSGADPFFDGARLALKTGAVVVTLNYRLGPLGFLVTDEAGKGGMNGLRDVVVALGWVQRNIRALGGDAARVTLFGESAGGCATCTLAMAPAAEGLFARAVVESGPCYGKWGPEPRAKGLEEARLLEAEFGDLKTAPAAKLRWRLPTGGYFLDDGEVMGAPPDAKRLHVETLAIGGTSFDGTSELLPEFPGENATRADYRAALRVKYGDAAAAVEQVYPPSRFAGSAAAAFAQADADHIVVCPSLRIARESPVDTYLYRFQHLQRECDLGVLLGAIPVAVGEDLKWAAHGGELFFVFNNTEFKNPLDPSTPLACNFTADEEALSAAMMDLWGGIARDGRPGAAWPLFAAANETLLLQTPTIVAARDVKVEDCAFWDAIDRGSMPGFDDDAVGDAAGHVLTLA